MSPARAPLAGALAALGAAALFGASTPAAKWLLASVQPWMLAALLYLGSGAGLSVYRLARGLRAPRLARHEWRWLLAAILAGGVAAPVLLLFGLTHLPGSTSALMLNAETVFTALLAWFVFHENVDRRIALGMALIAGGAVVLAWPGDAMRLPVWPAFAVLGACLAWALDNNLTRKIALADATWIAALKGVVAGGVNLLLAVSLGAALPALGDAVAALAVGSVAYGVSLALFVIALRTVGTARTGAYFAVAPFCGAALAVPLLGEPVDGRLLVAGALMVAGVALHLTERHAHFHTHEAIEHEHDHVHDAHHQHAHDDAAPTPTRHSHRHRHAPLTHEHAHYPDAHHRHRH